MNFIRFAIENPVKVAVGVLLTVLFGLLALFTIPVQLTPDVDQPIITVSTDWTGRSPEEIEREIIEPQEDVLKNVSGLQKMTATANQGQGQIELEFVLGTDTNNARQEVSDSLREVPEYPDEADEPVVQESEAGAGSPIAWLLLTAEGDYDVQQLGDSVEERIKPYLERTPGVSEVRVYGGREREVHIQVDPTALAQRGITFNQFNNALRGRNVNVSAGTIAEGNYDVRVRTIGQLEDLDTVRELIVAYAPDGGPIRIGDLADVELTYAKRRSFVRARGQIALALPVYRETGANVISIMEDLNERIGVVNDELLPAVAARVQSIDNLPEQPQFHLGKVYDETGYIYDALYLVRDNLFIGGTLAGLALLVFLRVIRPTLIVALSIPISIIGTFVVMAALGRNVNVISLAGLAFAVGMVVDAAIVVLENIDRHLGMGKRPAQAAYDGAREVWGAIFASAATTLAVFLPVVFIQEEAGQLFRDIAIAICAAVALSLIVAVTVIPSASARFLSAHREPRLRITRAGRALFGLAPVCAWLADRFSSIMYRLTAPNAFGAVARAGIVATFTLVSIGGAWALMTPADYLPRGNQNLVFGFLLTPPGYNIEHYESIGRRVESTIRPYWEAEDYDDLEETQPPIHPMTGQPLERVPPIENYFFVSFQGSAFNGATSGDPANVSGVADLLTAATSSIPGTIGFAQQSSLFGRGAGGSRTITVEVLGPQMPEVERSALALMQRLRAMYGAYQVQPTPSNFDKPAPETRVRIDAVRAAELGIDEDSLGAGVRALVDGLNVGDYRLQGESIDILAVADPTLDLQLDDLAQQPLAYIDGRGETGIVPLSAVANFERADAPQQIRRIDEQRAVWHDVTPPDNVPLEQATLDIAAAVDELREAGEIPPSVAINLAGSASKLQEVKEAMLGEWYGAESLATLLSSLKSLSTSRIFLALLVTYLLMAALFESFLYPFVILFAVPLATVGGFLGLAFVHDGWGMQQWPLIGERLYTALGPEGIRLISPEQQLDTLTMLGFIILIGIVVNNAILIVHQALNFMRGVGEGEGDQSDAMAPREAIRASVRSRIRPVFMTTITSTSGMLPLVVMPGSGSELYRGLGSVVVGGLLVAALFTLIVVPLLFSLVLDLKRGILRRVFKSDLSELQDAGGLEPA